MSKNALAIATCIGVIVIAGGVHFMMQKKQAEDAVKAWMQSQPVNAIVFRDHPELYPKARNVFAKAYEAKGQAGFAPAQISWQQTLDEYYLVDYAWYVDDAALKEYMTKEYLFLKALYDKTRPPPADAAKKKKKTKKKKGGPTPALCDAIVRGDASPAKAASIVGDETYKAYMQASEKLFLTARDKNLYPVWPGVQGYQQAVRSAQQDVARSLLSSFADPLTAIQALSGGRENATCDQALIVYYAMLKSPGRGWSLAWRASAEDGRQRIVEKRKKNGF